LLESDATHVCIAITYCGGVCASSSHSSGPSLFPSAVWIIGLCGLCLPSPHPLAIVLVLTVLIGTIWAGLVVRTVWPSCPHCLVLLSALSGLLVVLVPGLFSTFPGILLVLPGVHGVPMAVVVVGIISLSWLVSLVTQTYDITNTHTLTRDTHAPTRATHAPSRATHAPSRATHAPSRATYAPTRATHAPSRATYAPTTYAPDATHQHSTRSTYGHDWPGSHIHAACLMRPPSYFR
jgi:hypothetical protein